MRSLTLPHSILLKLLCSNNGLSLYLVIYSIYSKNKDLFLFGCDAFMTNNSLLIMVKTSGGGSVR